VRFSGNIQTKESLKAIFEVFTVVKIEFFRLDGGRTALQNVAIQPPHYTAQQPRKPRIQSWKGGGPYFMERNFRRICTTHFTLIRT